MARVIQSPAAKADAIEIWVYIAQDNIDAADRLLHRFDKLFRLLLTQPFLGKSIDEFAPDLRFIPVGNYMVFYRPTEDGIEIIRLLHGARDIGANFFQE